MQSFSYVKPSSDANDILSTLKKPDPPVPAANIEMKYPKLQALLQKRAEEKARLEVKLKAEEQARAAKAAAKAAAAAAAADAARDEESGDEVNAHANFQPITESVRARELQSFYRDEPRTGSHLRVNHICCSQTDIQQLLRMQRERQAKAAANRRVKEKPRKGMLTEN